jgi:hypothetical protein
MPSHTTWTPCPRNDISGAIAVGFLDEERVLVGTPHDLTVVDARSGRAVHRVASPPGVWLKPPSIEYVDSTGSLISVQAGGRVSQGKLPISTPDKWCYAIAHHEVIVHNSSVGHDPSDRAVLPMDPDEHESHPNSTWVFGFSPKGLLFVFASSLGVQFLQR